MVNPDDNYDEPPLAPEPCDYCGEFICECSCPYDEEEEYCTECQQWGGDCECWDDPHEWRDDDESWYFGHEH